jgi:hypothetical protein
MKEALNPDWYHLVRSEIKKSFEKRDNVILLRNNFKMLSYLDWVHKSWIDRAIADDEVFDYISNIDLMIRGEYDFIWKDKQPVTVFPYAKSKKYKK